MKAVKTMSSVVLASVLVYGCGGGGSGSGTPSPNGIYSGVITGGRGTPPNGDEIGVIYDNRMMVFSTVFDIQNMFESEIAVSGSNISGTLNVYNNKTAPLIGTAELVGSYVSQTSVSATFSNATDVSINDGTIELSYEAEIYSKGSSQDRVTGSWQGTHGNLGNATSISIDAAGDFTGSDLEGCNFTGSVNPANTSVNVYNVTLISTGGAGCVSLPASTYTGLAWTIGATDATMNFTVSDGNYSRSVILTKM